MRVTSPPVDFHARSKIRAGGICNLHNRLRIESRMSRKLALIFLFALPLPATAEITPYVGVIGGIATLSADAGSRLSPQGLSSSSYSPANGGALNVFAGVHLHDYFSLQANYIRNQNDLL